MSNFHILSLSESLTQTITSAMIIGRAERLAEKHVHTHTWQQTFGRSGRRF